MPPTISRFGSNEFAASKRRLAASKRLVSLNGGWPESPVIGPKVRVARVVTKNFRRLYRKFFVTVLTCVRMNGQRCSRVQDVCASGWFLLRAISGAAKFFFASPPHRFQGFPGGVFAPPGDLISAGLVGQHHVAPRGCDSCNGKGCG